MSVLTSNELYYSQDDFPIKNNMKLLTISSKGEGAINKVNLLYSNKINEK